MLDRLRSFASSPIGILVFGAIIIAMLAFGLNASGRQNVIARVGSQEIIAQDFQRQYQTVLSQVAQQQGVITAPIRQEVGNYVLFNVMLSAAARDDHIYRLGLGLSDEAVAAAIARDPAFRTSDGSFSQTLVENYLRSTGLTERDLIDQQRANLLRAQVAQAILPEDAALPPGYSSILDDFFLEQRTVEYTIVTADALGDAGAADPTDEEIATYFEENADNWAAPEMRTVDLLVLRPEDIADPAAVTDEEALADYESRSAEFGTAEERTVFQQIFATRADADAVAARLDEGASYDDLVADGTIAPTSLGTLTRNQLFDPAIAEAAFSLEEGGTVIADGRSGATLVYVSEVISASIPPFEDVAEEIRNDIAMARAAAAINEFFLQIEDARAGGLTLPEVGAELGFDVSSATFDAAGNDANGDPIDDLPGGTDVVSAAFESDVGLADAAIRLPGVSSYVWYEVSDVIAPHQRELEDVHDDVVAAWRNDAVDLRLQTMAESIAGLLRQDEPIADIEAELGVTFSQVDAIQRISEVPEGLPSNFVPAAFGGAVGFVTIVSDDDGAAYVILKVIDSGLAEGEPDELVTVQTDNIRAQLVTAQISSYLNDLIARLGSPNFDEELIQQVIGVQ